MSNAALKIATLADLIALVTSRQKSWEVQYLRCSFKTRLNDALDLRDAFCCS